MEEFQVTYTDIVVKRDIPVLPSMWGNKIKQTIESRLMKDPVKYGKPLRANLAGYRKLRVGDYRVVFRIEGKVVRVFLIAHRKNSYKVILGRI